MISKVYCIVLVFCLSMPVLGVSQNNPGKWQITGGLIFNPHPDLIYSQNLTLSGGYVFNKGLVIGLAGDFTYEHSFGRRLLRADLGPFTRYYFTNSHRIRPYIDMRIGVRVADFRKGIPENPGPDPGTRFLLKSCAGFTWFPGKQKRLGIDLSAGLGYEFSLTNSAGVKHLNPVFGIGIVWMLAIKNNSLSRHKQEGIP